MCVSFHPNFPNQQHSLIQPWDKHCALSTGKSQGPFLLFTQYIIYNISCQWRDPWNLPYYPFNLWGQALLDSLTCLCERFLMPRRNEVVFQLLGTFTFAVLFSPHSFAVNCTIAIPLPRIARVVSRAPHTGTVWTVSHHWPGQLVYSVTSSWFLPEVGGQCLSHSLESDLSSIAATNVEEGKNQLLNVFPFLQVCDFLLGTCVSSPTHI